MPHLPLWSIVAAPLAGSLVAGALGRRLGKRAVGTVACLAVATAFVASVSASLALGEAPLHERLYTWFDVGPVAPAIGFQLDPLSAIWALVITGVGLAIHLFAASYMAEDESYGRFFCVMNLFVASMLVLVLADNLLFLYLGWEGVGVCSYLLIGFWYRERANVAAAIKAFVVTRVGDVALAAGLFLLAWELGSLELAELGGATSLWDAGDPTVTLIAALLLAGAVAKSAQVPLQIWLPDAMAGPTPVSALLHAATMVTAGVYLVARTHVLFLLAPTVLGVVATIGAITALTAACSALVQTDIKRVLAYSTISQIGFMFTALGVGAFVAGAFHFLTHAFFKALLFLVAGMVTHAVHEADITRLGGLRKHLPGVATLGLVGAAALAGLPLVTSGFYSKEAIVTASLLSPLGGDVALYVVLTITAALTALYSFRWFFLIFAGDEGPAVKDVGRPPALQMWACGILAVGALTIGFVETPALLGGVHLFPDFMEGVFPEVGPPEPAFEPVPVSTVGAPLHPTGTSGAPLHPTGTPGLQDAQPAAHSSTLELALLLVAGAVSLLGLLFAYQVWVLRPAWAGSLSRSAIGRVVTDMWRSGWHADDLYRALVVRPFARTVEGLRGEPVDSIAGFLAMATRDAHRVLSITQSGRLRTYAAVVVLGVILLLGVWLWR